MDDFDTFKASREKIDPSSRKFSKRQWQKAYAAYRDSRERVKEGSTAKSAHTSGSRRSASRRGSSYRSSNLNPALILRSEVRQNSAYRDLRMVLDFLTWIAVGLLVLAGAVKLLYYTNPSAALASILESITMVVVLVALRLLAHVVIDIPDIALLKKLSKETRLAKETDASE